MKTPHFRLLTRLAAILVVGGAVIAAMAQVAEKKLPELPLNSLLADTPLQRIAEDRQVTALLRDRKVALIRVTEKPHEVPNLGSLCSPPPAGSLFTPHDDFWIHVFINPEAAEIIKSGKGVYPEGTIILKQKFHDAEAKQTEFYTGMRKREKDYNPDYGDWEFFTLDSAGTKVTARGKIDSCMDCHANWKETDFVSRKYLRQPPTAPVTR